MKIAKWLLIVGFWIGMGLSGAASAHDYLGTLGTAATAKDIWYFTCSNPRTAKLVVQVKRPAGKPCIKAQVSSPAATLNSCSTAYTLPKILPTRSGAKVFTLSKSPAAAGIAVYIVKADCLDNTSVQNPEDQTSPQTYIQNQ
jgi:hypothetical protein